MTRKQQGAVLAAVGAAGIAAGLGVVPVIAAGAVMRALRGADERGGKKAGNARSSTRWRSSTGAEIGAEPDRHA